MLVKAPGVAPTVMPVHVAQGTGMEPSVALQVQGLSAQLTQDSGPL